MLVNAIRNPQLPYPAAPQNPVARDRGRGRGTDRHRVNKVDV